MSQATHAENLNAIDRGFGMAGTAQAALTVDSAQREIDTVDPLHLAGNVRRLVLWARALVAEVARDEREHHGIRPS